MTAPVTGASTAAVPATGTPRARLQAAAHQLEAVFYGQLFQAMRATIPEGGVVERGTGEQMFTAMLDDEVARAASQQTDRGLATSIYHELSRSLPPDPIPVATTPTPAGAAPAAPPGIPLAPAPFPLKPND
ncbi:MAG TPA: rod-binding protein [Gemmatimonadales bacterium]|jgi:Rod binding domain-containing protein